MDAMQAVDTTIKVKLSISKAWIKERWFNRDSHTRKKALFVRTKKKNISSKATIKKRRIGQIPKRNRGIKKLYT